MSFQSSFVKDNYGDFICDCENFELDYYDLTSFIREFYDDVTQWNGVLFDPYMISKKATYMSFSTQIKPRFF